MLFLLNITVLITFFTIASARNILGGGPKTEFDWKDKHPPEQFPPKTSADSASVWFQGIVLQMHYDCQGRLMRQVASKLKIQTGLFLVPGEEDLLDNVHRRLEPLPTASGEESNDVNRMHDGRSGSVTVTQAPLIFRSMRERFRTRPNIPTTPSVDQTTSDPAVELNTTREQTTREPTFEIGPDQIIDVPIRSCPEGQNEDLAGECRPVFSEY